MTISNLDAKVEALSTFHELKANAPYLFGDEPLYRFDPKNPDEVSNAADVRDFLTANGIATMTRMVAKAGFIGEPEQDWTQTDGLYAIGGHLIA